MQCYKKFVSQNLQETSRQAPGFLSQNPTSHLTCRLVRYLKYPVRYHSGSHVECPINLRTFQSRLHGFEPHTFPVRVGRCSPFLLRVLLIRHGKWGGCVLWVHIAGCFNIKILSFFFVTHNCYYFVHHREKWGEGMWERGIGCSWRLIGDAGRALLRDWYCRHNFGVVRECLIYLRLQLIISCYFSV